MSSSTVEAPADLDASTARRRARYEARHTLWDETSLPRVRNCGRAVRSNEAGVNVRVSEGSAGYAGLQSCGSFHACPVCSAKIAAHRQGEIERALDAWSALGGRVALGTFTMSHRKGQRLKTLWDGLSYAWHSVASGAGWQADKLTFGRLLEATDRAGRFCFKGDIPMIRVFETTKGDRGWHVHVHVLLLLPGDTTDEKVARLEARMWSRWRDGLAAKGFRARRTVKSEGVVKSLGADLRLLDKDAGKSLGEYFTKSVYSPAKSASMEVARGDLKKARHGNRTPFAILESVVTTGDADDLDDWHEWERASKGRRSVAWSRGLRDELLAGETELTDDEIADQEIDGQVVAVIDRDTWANIAAARADWLVLTAFLRDVEQGRRLVDRYRV